MITRRLTTSFILSLFLLSSCALIEPAPGVRIVKVKVLADPSFQQEDPRWVDTAAGLLEAASDFFEREFGIRFLAQGVTPWQLAGRFPSTALLLKRLKDDFPLRGENRSYDLIVAFTRERVNVYLGGVARVDRIGNCQDGLGNYVISLVSAPYRYPGPNSELELDVVALIHELGHIFGAEHTEETGSIMHMDFAYRTEFDKKSREIILKNRHCPFGK